MKKVAFIFSGRGSLLKTVEECLESLSVESEVALIITNNPVIEPKQLGIQKKEIFYCLDHKNYATRSEHEQEISSLLNKHQIDLIVLGGYRRIFSSDFIEKYGYKTINTHPSLLPAFIGDKAQLNAIKRGVRITGATVHFINNEVDQGPIITQAAVRVKPYYSEQDLKEAIINVEKKALARAVKLFIENKLQIEDNVVCVPPGYEEELFV